MRSTEISHAAPIAILGGIGSDSSALLHSTCRSGDDRRE